MRTALFAAALGAALAVAGAALAGTEAVPTSERLQGHAQTFRTWLPRALRGDAGAAYQLGTAYAEGEGRAEDFAEAARWFHRAAALGHPGAQSDLGLLYAKGLGVAQDYVRAYAWFDLAAAGFGHGLRHDQALELRAMMDAFLSPAERAEAERLAARWKAAGQ